MQTYQYPHYMTIRLIGRGGSRRQRHGCTCGGSGHAWQHPSLALATTTGSSTSTSHTAATASQRAAAGLHILFVKVLDNGSLLSTFHASLRSFLLAHHLRRGSNVAGVMGNLAGLLDSSQGTHIDVHYLVVRLNNARVVSYTVNAGTKISLSFINSKHFPLLRRALPRHHWRLRLPPHCPMAMYVC